jgi:proteasome lid subunit RPN8/RPN11
LAENRAIAINNIIDGVKRYASRLSQTWERPRREPLREYVAPREIAPPLSAIRNLVLTDEVARTLFGEYEEHRASVRGSEETGWVLLGVRRAAESIVMATLPAGSQRDAGDCHVRFDPLPQTVASRIVRQSHKQLTMLGVVHTHPGSMRHPSDGDFRGDIEWVAQRKGGEGIFGIGTADATSHDLPMLGWQPAENRQCLGKLGFSWYSLAVGDRAYRPLTVSLTIGPDLALPLRQVWTELEKHAERLERLVRQLNHVSFEVVDGVAKPALAMDIPLADSGRSLRTLMEGADVRYLLCTPDGDMIAEISDPCVDRAVFTILAELAS